MSVSEYVHEHVCGHAHGHGSGHVHVCERGHGHGSGTGLGSGHMYCVDMYMNWACTPNRHMQI